jgi:hypothetical protein
VRVDTAHLTSSLDLISVQGGFACNLTMLYQLDHQEAFRIAAGKAKAAADSFKVNM